MNVTNVKLTNVNKIPGILETNALLYYFGG